MIKLILIMSIVLNILAQKCFNFVFSDQKLNTATLYVLTYIF
jgi:hypothetical protein